MLASIVQVLGRFIRVDDATIRGEHCIFARVCIEIDLRLPLKRVLVLHPHDDSEEPSIVRVSYEALFEICFLCGNFTHRFEACPGRVMERHFLMVDRLLDEPAVYPPEMQEVEGVHLFASNDSMVFFPQPVTTYANVVNGGHGTQATRDVDDSEQSSPTWTAVSRARNRGVTGNYNGRGGIRTTAGTRVPRANEPAARSVPASPYAGNGARSKISLRERQVDDNNIIILPDSTEEEAFQDATEVVQNDMAAYANPDAEINDEALIDDTSDGFFEEPVDPMNYVEARDTVIVRKRSRDMFNTDDELDIGSNSVNPNP